MDYIYFNNFDYNKMGLDYKAYKEFCDINDIEPCNENSSHFYEWCRDECDVEWENVEWEIKHYDKEHYGHYYVDANIGRWNGRSNAFNVFNSLEKAIFACIDNMDYIEIELINDGTINVTAIHHDGRNYFTIKKMTEEAYERYDDWKWNESDESFELQSDEIVSMVA